MISFDEFWELMKEIHQKYFNCDLPCFTKEDVVNAIFYEMLCLPFVREHGTTSVVTGWGTVFGNAAYEHFIEAYNEALRRFDEFVEFMNSHDEVKKMRRDIEQIMDIIWALEKRIEELEKRVEELERKIGKCWQKL